MAPVGTWLRHALLWRHRHLVVPADRLGVLEHVKDAGTLAPRYAFMTLMSCGIATLGLLQNSAAVIIGAMLISPLMGPIIQLGMGLATFDFRSVRDALKTLVVGIVLTLGLSIAIVLLSPLKDATAEILARTEPTLFDLLVAIFSGLAGAYATITRKGETIVGVAIATALMPPLAVTGIGIALGNINIAGGAAFLFMTNLLAIALSATVMGRIYGFGGRDTPKQSVWQAALIIGTFALLSVPLGLALRKIAARAQTEAVVRGVLDRAASDLAGRITTMRVDTASSPMLVDAVLMTPRHEVGLERQLEATLGKRFGHAVNVQLREVITTDDDAQARQQASLAELRTSVEELRGAADQTRLSQQQAAMRDTRVRDAILAQLGTLQPSADGNGFELRLRTGSAMRLAQAYSLEQAVRTLETSSQLVIVPPVQPLLPILFERAETELDDAGRQAAAIDAWTLSRWNVAAVMVTGHAPGRQQALALRRAEAVAAVLRERGQVVAEVGSQVLSPDGRERVEIELLVP